MVAYIYAWPIHIEMFLPDSQFTCKKIYAAFLRSIRIFASYNCNFHSYVCACINVKPGFLEYLIAVFEYQNCGHHVVIIRKNFCGALGHIDKTLDSEILLNIIVIKFINLIYKRNSDIFWCKVSFIFCYILHF